MPNSLIDLFRSAPKPRPSSIFIRPGVYGLSSKFVKTVSGGDAFAPYKGFLEAITSRRAAKGLRESIGPSYKWDLDVIKTAHNDFKRTGVLPVFVSRSVRPTSLESVIRHEQIHAAHFMNPNHPFFTHALEDTKPLNRILKESGQGEEFLTHTRQLYTKIFREARKVNKRGAKFALDSERLAYTFMHDETFLSGAEAAGVKTHLSLASMVRGSHTAPGRSKSLIQGLRDSGLACRIRKVLTNFGSGWQGQKPQMAAPEKFLKLVGATESSIKATDLQHGRYQSPGQLEEIVEAFRQKKPVEPVEIFLDEYRNIIGAEGRHRALAAMKAGVKEIPIIIRKRVAEKAAEMTENIMATGEGQAIAKAGTATMSTTFKATSRIIRSAL